ncbi:MAG: HAD family hydrolase [Chloroflexi bacterium]|nr:HAD family hydrolase [Chloroflexota bacterium]
MHPALFLDRDGVIIENRKDYVRAWEQVEILPGSLEALASAARSAYKIVIVTNQSAVGRGILSPETAAEINQRLLAVIRQAGGRIDGVYMCPHAPEAACACRKPQPGLLLQAAAELDLDLSRSIMIGDAWSDLLAGQAAGVGRVALLSSGRGWEERQKPAPESLKGALYFAALADALESLLD